VGAVYCKWNCLFTADSGNTLAVAELDIAAMDNEIQRWYTHMRAPSSDLV